MTCQIPWKIALGTHSNERTATDDSRIQNDFRTQKKKDLWWESLATTRVPGRACIFAGIMPESTPPAHALQGDIPRVLGLDRSCVIDETPMYLQVSIIEGGAGGESGDSHIVTPACTLSKFPEQIVPRPCLLAG